MPPAVKVYGWAMSPFVARALLCLEEASVEYELVAMNPEAGDHLRPDFLTRNPFAQSRARSRGTCKPELLAGDGSPEAAAMVDVWLEVEAQQHHAPTGAIMLQCIVVPLRGGVRDQAVVDENVAKLRKVLEVYEARLSTSRYLAGEYVALVEELKARPAARKVTEHGVQAAERWAQEKGRAAVN
ncbi:hypothetical protein ACQ4PT_068209 [Festuca glaucescens]